MKSILSVTIFMIKCRQVVRNRDLSILSGRCLSRAGRVSLLVSDPDRHPRVRNRLAPL